MGEPLPFVGRAGVLGEVGAALRAARAGRGGLVLLTGPGGAGKTRIATEACAGADGFRVVWTWCPPGDALGPWTQVLRDVIASDVVGGRVAQESPELRAVVTGSGGDIVANPEQARRRLARDVSEALRAGATAKPLLVVIDDVHDADASSLRLLAEVAGAVRTAPVVLLATARDDERSWRGRAETRAVLLGRGLCLPVTPLGRSEVAELITAATGRAATDDEVGAVLARTGGEAFFVTELVRHGLSGPVPASVRAVVQARLATLTRDCASALAAASVLGVRFRLDVLAEVTGVPLADLRAVLADAAEAGLLGALEPGVAAFRHQLLADAVRDALTPGERAELNARAADVLARFAERGRDVGAAQVARHFLDAGPERAGEAARFAWLAADHAADLLAYDEAVAWYTRCRELSETPDLLIASGVARLGASDRPGARADFLRAATLTDDPELLARAALGLGSSGVEVDMLDREQVELLERARAASPPDALLAAVTARLSVATTLIEPDDRRLALAEEALELARRAGDPAALAQALAALCDAKPGPDFCADRAAWAAEIVDLARRLRDPVLELLGRRLRLVALLETGSVAAADAEILAFESVTALLDQPFYSWYPPLWRGMRALLEGRFDDCRAALAETSKLADASGSTNAWMLAETQRWFLLADSGDHAEAARMASDAQLEDIPGIWPQVTLALVAAQLGRLDEARDRLSGVLPRLPAAFRDSEWLPMLAQVAETVALAGPHPIARPVYELLSPYADLFVVEGIGAALRGPVHYYLALLAAALGEPDAGHRENALVAAKAIGATRLAASLETTVVAGDDVFLREGEVWVLRFAGREVRLPDAKGLHDLALLLGRPGVGVPAVDLAAPPDRDRPRADGDFGEVVDATARDAYRRRLAQLDADEEAADAAGDALRSKRIAEERAALIDQLSAATGLGGRPRRSGSTAERARTAVTARIRATVDRIARGHPELGRHLSAAVRTGTVCVYEPETPHTWRTFT